jgi:hypothetical protein
MASTMEELSRATSVDGVRAKMKNFGTATGRADGLALSVRPTDIFVATFPKCGTTLLQQIVHGLRSNGDMDFAEISVPVPWLEMSRDMGIDPHGDQIASPRAFKTHCNWNDVPKGGKYIYVLRDPCDVVVSFFHFFSGWVFEPGSIPFEEFAREFVVKGTGSGRYWDHLASYWPKRDDADTLLLCFEDVTANLEGTVRRVAEFMELDVSADTQSVATEQASFSFMKAHEGQFNDNVLRALRNRPTGLPDDAYNTKVRAGRVGDNADTISGSLRNDLNALWAEIVLPVTGHADYPSLRADVLERSRIAVG